MYYNKTPWKYGWIDTLESWILKFSFSKLNFENWILRFFFLIGKKVNLSPWLVAWFRNILMVAFLLSRFVYFYFIPESSVWQAAAELEYKVRKWDSSLWGSAQ